jgi:hypothetical protein
MFSRYINSFLIIDVVEIALNRAERRNALGKELLTQVNKCRRRLS